MGETFSIGKPKVAFHLWILGPNRHRWPAQEHVSMFPLKGSGSSNWTIRSRRQTRPSTLYIWPSAGKNNRDTSVSFPQADNGISQMAGWSLLLP
jgi:hypothetical protein